MCVCVCVCVCVCECMTRLTSLFDLFISQLCIHFFLLFSLNLCSFFFSLSSQFFSDAFFFLSPVFMSNLKGFQSTDAPVFSGHQPNRWILFDFLQKLSHYKNFPQTPLISRSAGTYINTTFFYNENYMSLFIFVEGILLVVDLK